jgi:hypothetical protein
MSVTRFENGLLLHKCFQPISHARAPSVSVTLLTDLLQKPLSQAWPAQQRPLSTNTTHVAVLQATCTPAGKQWAHSRAAPVPGHCQVARLTTHHAYNVSSLLTARSMIAMKLCRLLYNRVFMHVHIGLVSMHS